MIGQALTSGILTGGIYSLAGIGMALVFGVMGVSNFAHGSIMMVAMYATYYLNSLLGIDPYASLIIVIPGMFLFGVALQKTLISRVMDKSPEAHILLTIGISLILANIAMLSFTADYKMLKNNIYASSAFNVCGIAFSVPLIISFIITCLITAGLAWFLSHTYTGQALRATSQNKEAAKLMGIDVAKMGMLAFGIGSALAGAAGALLTPVYAISPEVGHTFLLKCFVVCTLGGLGSIPGAAIGGLIIGVVEALTLSSTHINSEWKDVIVFSVFLAVLIIKPAGLFGKKG